MEQPAPASAIKNSTAGARRTGDIRKGMGESVAWVAFWSDDSQGNVLKTAVPHLSSRGVSSVGKYSLRRPRPCCAAAARLALQQRYVRLPTHAPHKPHPAWDEGILRRIHTGFRDCVPWILSLLPATTPAPLRWPAVKQPFDASRTAHGPVRLRNWIQWIESFDLF